MEKNKWSDLNIKEKTAIISAILAFVVGWGLTISGFIVPPMGEVADSVLWILGQALIYSASVFGITSYFTTEQRKLRKELKDYFDELSAEKNIHE